MFGGEAWRARTLRSPSSLLELGGSVCRRDATRESVVIRRAGAPPRLQFAVKVAAECKRNRAREIKSLRASGPPPSSICGPALGRVQSNSRGRNQSIVGPPPGFNLRQSSESRATGIMRAKSFELGAGPPPDFNMRPPSSICVTIRLRPPQMRSRNIRDGPRDTAHQTRLMVASPE